jgi:hypothetical protein
MPRSRAGEVDEHPDDGGRGQDRDGRGPAREEPERDAGVGDVPDFEGADDVHGLAELELADYDLLRHLVGDDRRERHGEEAEPVERRRRQRALDHGDRDASVRGRADANVDQPCRRAD